MVQNPPLDDQKESKKERREYWQSIINKIKDECDKEQVEGTVTIDKNGITCFLWKESDYFKAMKILNNHMTFSYCDTTYRDKAEHDQKLATLRQKREEKKKKQENRGLGKFLAKVSEKGDVSEY